MIAFAFFLIDFICFSLFDGWYVQSLLIYFIFNQLMEYEDVGSLRRLYIPLILLLLQDCFFHGRFGLALIYLLPIAVWAGKLRMIFLDAAGALLYVFIINSILFEHFFIKKLLLSGNISLFGTLFKICVNLCLGYLVLLGTRGNRSLLKFFNRGRKVWTPNRKGAL